MTKMLLIALAGLSTVGCSAEGPDWQLLFSDEVSRTYIDRTSVQQGADGRISAWFRSDSSDGSAFTAAVKINCDRSVIDMEDVVLYDQRGQLLARVGRDGYVRDSSGRLIRAMAQKTVRRAVDPRGPLGVELLSYC